MKSILFRLQILGGNAKWRQLVEIQMKKTDFLWSGRKAILVGKMLIKKIAQYWQQWKIYNEHNQTNPIVFLVSQVPKTQNLLGFYVKSILVNLTKVFVGQEFSKVQPLISPKVKWPKHHLSVHMNLHFHPQSFAIWMWHLSKMFSFLFLFQVIKFSRNKLCLKSTTEKSFFGNSQHLIQQSNHAIENQITCRNPKSPKEYHNIQV